MRITSTLCEANPYKVVDTLEHLIVRVCHPLITYTGNTHLNGVYHGRISAKNKKGDRLIANISKAGIVSGQGIIGLKSGFIYKGDLHTNFAHGRGTLTKDGKLVFVGNWVRGQFQMGDLVLSNGVRYRGKFCSGHLTDIAKIISSCGQVSKLQISGQIIDTFLGLFYTNSAVFDVQVENKQGFGTVYYKNGIVYQGSIDQMRPHGQGQFFYPDRTSAKGTFDFKSGVINFSGRFPRSPSDHTMFEGEWVNGIGQATV